MSLEKLRSLEEIYATFEGIADGGAPTFLSLQTEIMFNMAVDIEFIADQLDVPLAVEVGEPNGDLYPGAVGTDIFTGGIGESGEGEGVGCDFCVACWVLDNVVDEVDVTELDSSGP